MSKNHRSVCAQLRSLTVEIGRYVNLEEEKQICYLNYIENVFHFVLFIENSIMLCLVRKKQIL